MTNNTYTYIFSSLLDMKNVKMYPYNPRKLQFEAKNPGKIQATPSIKKRRDTNLGSKMRFS